MCLACAAAACVLAFTLTPASPPGRCPHSLGKLAGTPMTFNTWPLLPAPHLPPILPMLAVLKYLQLYTWVSHTVMWIFAPSILSLVNSDSAFKIQFIFYLLWATLPKIVNCPFLRPISTAGLIWPLISWIREGASPYLPPSHLNPSPQNGLMIIPFTYSCFVLRVKWGWRQWRMKCQCLQ